MGIAAMRAGRGWGFAGMRNPAGDAADVRHDRVRHTVRSGVQPGIDGHASVPGPRVTTGLSRRVADSCTRSARAAYVTSVKKLATDELLKVERLCRTPDFRQNGGLPHLPLQQQRVAELVRAIAVFFERG